MLQGEKILVTGPAGQIAFPLASTLARDNDVWGIARFSDTSSRERVEAAGITTRACDLASGDFDDVPTDFTYVLHLATFRNGGLDYDQAMRVNAEGTHLLLEHCRRAKAALIMSTAEVYKPQLDPMHVYLETDPMGDSNSLFDATYSMSKIAQEAVARSCARAYDLPVVIARMNASYGDNGGLLAYHLDWIQSGRPDIYGQTEALLHAASVPATIVNWGGDEPVAAQEWCAFLGELVGVAPDVVVKEVPGGIRGIILDNTKRLAITGPSAVTWRDGLRALVATRGQLPTSAHRQADRLLSSFTEPA
ncbi:MAG: NAD(P)-dependent oxidoreductase [Actinobacteria bacterium]|nr:MAG: NAD(P)-dependent oxidoreductase [Actinomycetota bacterium]